MNQEQETGAAPAAEGPAGEPAGAGAMVPSFLPPRLSPGRPRRQDPPPTGTPETTEPETEHGYADDVADVADVEPEMPTPAAGSSPASTGKPIRPLATRAQIEAAKRLTGAVLMAATGLINRRVAVHDADRRWLLSPGERDAIATPLARIIARRSPVSVDGESASDLADGVEAVTALIAYTIEQLQADPGPAPGVVIATATEPTTTPAATAATATPGWSAPGGYPFGTGLAQGA